MREGGKGPVAGTRSRPVGARLAVWLADALMRLSGSGAMAGRESISEAQLRSLVAANRAIDGEERRIIDEVLAAGARHVREVMVPRTDVVFLDAALPLPAAGPLIRAARYSRFPVIDGSHDDVVGFVHLRDLLFRPEPDGTRTVGELARDIKRLPAGKRILPALSEMRREGHHLAVVIDEYGGTAGIVTLEDLIEELVGEITDEYDAAPDPVPADGAMPAEVDGRLNLADFAELTGIDLPAGPYETVAGFLMARLGKLPGVGDETRLDSYRLVVVAVEGRRVARVALVAPVAPAPGGRLALD
jgi:putative hemolysin